ncbi:hypothetical protein FRC03_011390 [Tulasnella sp. 419]|nr:hypothetical protein FRC03_011390 [Tulasnella sp. 419]
MKATITDANFPRTADGRVYHLGLRHGEVANRIITVGDPSRARRIAQFLDASPQPFTLESERGFLTITGAFDGTPISIVAIGMGIANMDFFVRETRECVYGDMAIVRIGSCGSLIETLPVGSYVVPRACVAITRNYDYDFTASAGVNAEAQIEPYHISKPVTANQTLHDVLVSKMNEVRPEGSEGVVVAGNVVNAAADSGSKS